MDFILHESKILEQKKSEEKDKDSGSKWSFNFDSGKFKKEDIEQDTLQKIEDDFKDKILPTLLNPKLTGQKVTIDLIASTSKVPLGLKAKDELKREKYDPSNTGLATARLDTLEKNMKDLLFKYLGDKDDKEVSFTKKIENKIKIEKKPNPNQGPEYSEKEDKDSEKYKEHQKISSVIKVTNKEIERDRIIECNKEMSGKGSRGTKENYFAGYDKKVVIKASNKSVMKISFDPFTIPDCFFYKYEEEYGLSVFVGAFGPILVENFEQSIFDKRKKMAEEGETIMPEKKTIKGKDYMVTDYKKAINEIYNKDNALVNAINERIKKSGVDKDIKSIQPEFFDKEGKIEVYSKEDISKFSSSDSPNGKTTFEAIKSGAISQPVKCDPLEMEFRVKKKYTSDEFSLVVFSPCAGTQFKLKSSCSTEAIA